MDRRVLALVVSSHAQMLQRLQAVLLDQGVTVHCARTCEEARSALFRETAPDVVFAGASFLDATWKDLLQIAQQVSPPARVEILTSGPADIGLCLEATEKGAADLYIVPPFAASRPRSRHLLRRSGRRTRAG
jgi:DNA-binding NtrC family response regulator